MVTSMRKGASAATMPQAVCFDFDGVIADTGNVHIAAWERTFASMGWTVTPEVCARAAEIDDRAFLVDVFARRRIAQGDVEGWVQRKQEFTVAMLTFSPRLCPGAAALVRRLQQGARLAIVSSTWRDNVRTVLEAGGLLSAFEVIIGKEDVQQVKPDPEGYHLALERLGLAPADAVALEDSATGLQAALGAGLRCVVVGNGGDAPGWAGQAPYLPDLADADEALRVLALR
jgi:beta-phosphoglucomutase